MTLCKPKQEALHGGASSFVGLEKDNVGVLRLCIRGGTSKEDLAGIPEVSIVKQKTTNDEDNEGQK